MEGRELSRGGYRHPGRIRILPEHSQVGLIKTFYSELEGGTLKLFYFELEGVKSFKPTRGKMYKGLSTFKPFKPIRGVEWFRILL